MDNGIIYQGPSQLNGASIVVIALFSKANRKTGPMLQTYILDYVFDPRVASKHGYDESICGSCALRGEPTDDPKRVIAKDRKCYVNLGQGPLIVWKKWVAGGYRWADSTEQRQLLGADRMVRLGTYGDPAAVPDRVWEQLLSRAKNWTAYTHQIGWRPDIAMQSVEREDIARAFWLGGFRTFRIVQSVDDVVPEHEVLCPASKEAGARVQCADCKLCRGDAKAKSIAIVEH